MKLIKNILTLFIIVLIILLAINKTFIYEVYINNSTMSGEGIDIPRFMYLYEESSTTLKFITPLTYSYIEESKDEYLDSLTTCLGTYYYDEDNGITITEYSIIDKGYYRLVTISYSTTNYCSSEYILSDKWLYEYNSSIYVSGDITQDNTNILIDKIYESKRIDDVVLTDYESSITIEINLINDEEEYTIYFSDFKEDELLVKYVKGNSTMYAVYELDNVVEFLEGMI